MLLRTASMPNTQRRERAKRLHAICCLLGDWSLPTCTPRSRSWNRSSGSATSWAASAGCRAASSAATSDCVQGSAACLWASCCIPCPRRFESACVHRTQRGSADSTLTHAHPTLRPRPATTPTCSCGVPRWRRSSSPATSSMDAAAATSPCFLLSCSATATWARAVASATSRARGSRRCVASHSSPAETCASRACQLERRQCDANRSLQLFVAQHGALQLKQRMRLCGCVLLA